MWQISLYKQIFQHCTKIIFKILAFCIHLKNVQQFFISRLELITIDKQILIFLMNFRFSGNRLKRLTLPVYILQKIWQNMNSDYQAILEALQQSVSSDVSAVEQRLKKLAVDDINMLACLQRVLRDQTLDRDLKILGSSYINALFVENSADYPSEFSFKYITQVISDPAIMLFYKKQLNRALVHIIQRSNQQTVLKYKEFTEAIFKNCLPCQNKERWEQIQVAYMMLSSLCCGEIDSDTFVKLCSNTFEPSFQALYELLSSVSQDPTKVNAYLEIDYAIESWSIIIDYLIHLNTDDSQECLEKFMNSDVMCQTLQLIYFYASQPNPNISFTQQLYKNGLILTSNTFLYSEDQIMEINEVKNHAIGLHSKLLLEEVRLFKEQYKGKNSSQKQVHMQNRIIIFTGAMCEQLINALFLVSLNKDIMNNLDCQDYITGMVVLLRGFIELCPMVIMNTWRSLLHFVVFPLMETGDRELEEFQENAPGFVEISEDICEGQKLGLLKTQIAHLMEHIADNWKQITNHQCNIVEYILDFCIKSLKHQLKLQEITYQNQEEIQCRPLSVQCSFMVMSVFSYCFNRYPDFFEDLRIILCDGRIPNLPPLQKSRIFIFLSYNFSDLFKEPQHGGHLIDLALIHTSCDALTQCSFDFLFNIMNVLYSDKMALNIANRIHLGNDPINFWHLMRRLIQQHFTKMTEQVLVTFVAQCFIRLNEEFIKIQGQEIKVTQTISNLLGILRILADKLHILRSQGKILNVLKQEMSNIFNFMDISYQLNVGEDFIKVVNEFLYSCSQEEIQNHICKRLLQKVVSYHGDAKFGQSLYYATFNHFVMKGNYADTVVFIYRLMRDGLLMLVDDLSEKAFRGEQKIMISNHLIILQNIVGLFGNQLGERELQILKQASSKLFPSYSEGNNTSKSEQKKMFFDKVLITRALNLQVLCHLYYYDSEMITKLIRYQDLNIYELEVDIKVLISCMKVQIFKEKSIVDVTEILNVIIRAISKFQENQQKELIKSKKKNAKSKRNEDLLKIKIQRTINFSFLYSFIKTPFHSHDPLVKQFGELCDQLKEKNQPLYTSICRSMPLQTDIKFSNILSKYKEIKKTAPRKIFIVRGVKDANEQAQSTDHEPKEIQLKRDFVSDQEEQSEKIANQRQRVIQKRIKKFGAEAENDY